MGKIGKKSNSSKFLQISSIFTHLYVFPPISPPPPATGETQAQAQAQAQAPFLPISPHFPPISPHFPHFPPISPHFPAFFLALGTLWVRLWVHYPPPELGTSEPCMSATASTHTVGPSNTIYARRTHKGSLSRNPRSPTPMRENMFGPHCGGGISFKTSRTICLEVCVVPSAFSTLLSPAPPPPPHTPPPDPSYQGLGLRGHKYTSATMGSHPPGKLHAADAMRLPQPQGHTAPMRSCGARAGATDDVGCDAVAFSVQTLLQRQPSQHPLGLGPADRMHLGYLRAPSRHFYPILLHGTPPPLPVRHRSSSRSTTTTTTSRITPSRMRS